MEIQAGKSYHLRTPDSNGKVKVHIDYILDSPIYNNVDDNKLVVFRVWLKYKRYWKSYVEPYYVLCIFNDWYYNKNI